MGCQTTRIDLINQPHSQFVKPKQRQDLDTLISQGDLEEAQNIADSLFKIGNYLGAIKIYKQIIQAGYKVDFLIQGLGNAQLLISRYQWSVYEWYDSNRKSGKIKGNVFDALSLCLCMIRNSQQEIADKAIVWYEDMIDKNESIQLMIGYGNILYNRARYEEGLKIYNKVLKMNPQLINAQASIALTYEYRRIQKSKSTAVATQILQKDPQNMYAAFILARNEKDVDKKIQKLKSASQKFQYARITNQIGIMYGGTKKNYQQAILWYEKCTKIAPKYASAYNNIGVNHQLLKRYEQALPYYLKACELDHEYKTAHINASDIFDTLNYTDDKILDILKERPELNPYYFCYYLGLAYYDKKVNQKSITWYKRAEQYAKQDQIAKKYIFKLYNSFGITYDQMSNFEQGTKYYLKCIEINPKYYSAYYNLGILCKNQSNQQKAIQWYKKAIQANPRYAYAFNNLGNIYKNKGQFQQAINYYKSAVESLTTYTLSYANLAISYLKLNKYQDAFSCFQRAKQLLPTDNNNLSPANKTFLKQNLQLFDKEGEKWRKTGYIDQTQKLSLTALIKAFEANFKILYSYSIKDEVEDEKILDDDVLKAIKLIADTKFDINKADQLLPIVKKLFYKNEEYFHFLPQIFIQYFWKYGFKAKKPILQVQKQLYQFVHKISTSQAVSSNQSNSQISQFTYNMKNFNPPSDYKVNLFKNTTFFDSYQSLYAQIVKVNKNAQNSLEQFKDLVQNIRKRSQGIMYGVNLKMPKRKDQQFKVLLRIFEKMFKKQITQQKVKQIITKIDERIKLPNVTISLSNIILQIMEVWTSQITSILKDRSKKKQETVCSISDLLRGKLMFEKLDDLRNAIQSCDKLCKIKGYQILQLNNRLLKPQTMDVVLKIQVNDAVCELQLAMKQDETKYHFIHCIYEIERSPLGCIFGSYLFMSKGFDYPLLSNCKDIYNKLKQQQDQSKKNMANAAKFIFQSLEDKQTN